MYVDILSPISGEIRTLQVIDVVEQMAGPYAAPIATSQDTVDDLSGQAVLSTYHWFRVRPEMTDNVPDLAKDLERQFMNHGMSTVVMAE